MPHSNRRSWVIAVSGGVTIFIVALFFKINKISVVNFFDLGIVGVTSSFLLTILNDYHNSNQELLHKNEERLRTIESILSYFKDAEAAYKLQAYKLETAVESAEEKILKVQILLEMHCKNSENTAKNLEEAKKDLTELRIFIEALRFNK